MKMKTFVAALLLSTIAQTGWAQKRAFTIEDLYRVQYVYGLQLSPDGQQLLYQSSRSSLKQQSGQQTTWLYDVKGHGQQQLELGRAYDVRWSADGRALYYLSVDSGRPQLTRYDVADGHSQMLTRYALGISDPVVSPDSRYVAFTAQVYPDFGGSLPEKTLERQTRKAQGPVQAHLADRLLYRHWTDYEDGLCRHLVVGDLHDGTYRDLTPGAQSLPLNLGGEVQYAFSPDSRELCYLMNTTRHPEANTNCDLFTVSVEGGEARNLTADNPAWDGTPQYSPDGRYIAYRRQTVPGYESDCFTLMLYDRQAGTHRDLTPQLDNWVLDFQWSADGSSLYYTISEKGYQPLCAYRLKKGRTERLLEQRATGGFAVAPGGELFYTYSTTGKPTALYHRTAKGREEQLTFLNQALEDEVDMRPSETLWVEGADGDSVEVFVVKPHDFQPDRKYPLIINVHGGPQMQWMDSFRGDWQVYPGAGYVVAYPNPHGSTGYGQDFCRAISGDWGGRVYEDVMRVTDALEQLPYVDRDRMGAMGWSYGGYMMNWLQGHTRRFKCLASMMGVYDLRSMWGSTEELWFPEFEMGGRPWESALYEKWSPSAYIKDFATPTLIITGERDYRVPYTQSLQYFTALQSLDIPSRLIVLTNDGHWPGSLTSMPLYYNAHLEWFHRWLGGGEAPWDTEKMINNEIEYND